MTSSIPSFSKPKPNLIAVGTSLSHTSKAPTKPRQDSISSQDSNSSTSSQDPNQKMIAGIKGLDLAGWSDEKEQALRSELDGFNAQIKVLDKRIQKASGVKNQEKRDDLRSEREKLREQVSNLKIALDASEKARKEAVEAHQAGIAKSAEKRNKHIQFLQQQNYEQQRQFNQVLQQQNYEQQRQFNQELAEVRAGLIEAQRKLAQSEFIDKKGLQETLDGIREQLDRVVLERDNLRDMYAAEKAKRRRLAKEKAGGDNELDRLRNQVSRLEGQSDIALLAEVKDLKAQVARLREQSRKDAQTIENLTNDNSMLKLSNAVNFSNLNDASMLTTMQSSFENMALAAISAAPRLLYMRLDGVLETRQLDTIEKMMNNIFAEPTDENAEKEAEKMVRFYLSCLRTVVNTADKMDEVSEHMHQVLDHAETSFTDAYKLLCRDANAELNIREIVAPNFFTKMKETLDKEHKDNPLKKQAWYEFWENGMQS